MQGLDVSAHDLFSLGCIRISNSVFRDANILGLGKKAERFFAAFATDAALFHPAEGDAQVAHQPAIHPNRAGVNLLRDAMGAAEVLRPNARGEAVFGVVGVADNFVFLVEGRDRDDGSKNLFAINPASRPADR